MENVVLNAFKGDWGIASIDLDCLIQLSFSKFANAPVDINFKSLGINRLPYANLPSSGKLSSYEEFTGYLKDHKFDPNYHLPEGQKSLSLASTHQIRESLYPYYALTLFDNEANFAIVRKLYGQRIPFPFSLFYPGKLERHIKKFKETKYGLVLNEKDQQSDLQKATIEARIFLNTISKRLGNQRFYFGDKPSEFDAHLYSFLAILYHIKLPENPIQSHIAQCPNLVAYVVRITKNYFAEEAYDSGTVYEFSSYVRGGSGDAADGPSEKKERRFQILAGLFAIGLMGAFVATSGIFETGIFKRRLENIGYDDDDDDEDDDEI